MGIVACNKFFVHTGRGGFERLTTGNRWKAACFRTKARDQYRHPQQTLEFFDVKNNMTAVEIWSGEGWYTERLAPSLRIKDKDCKKYLAIGESDRMTIKFIKPK